MVPAYQITCPRIAQRLNTRNSDMKPLWEYQTNPGTDVITVTPPEMILDS